MINLVFICTHNSRRSILSEIWAAIAAQVLDKKTVQTFSAGTEKTEVAPQIIRTLKRQGFDIQYTTQQHNTEYRIKFNDDTKPKTLYSKLISDSLNPKESFYAILTCSDAEKNCPFVPGALKTFSLPFEDPKHSDGSPEEDAVYEDASLRIAGEIFYLINAICE